MGGTNGTAPERRQPPHVQRWQAVLNEHWPRRPRNYRDQHPTVPVRVRVVWETDGEEYLYGEAIRWDADHVYVRVRDITGRLAGQGVWVKPHDVYRLGEPAEA